MSASPTAYELLQRERKVKRAYKYLLNDLAWRLEHRRLNGDALWTYAEQAVGAPLDSEVKAHIVKMLKEQR